MRFRPVIWFPVALVLSLVNMVAVWFAAQPAEPMHATVHAALAVAFGVWAQRLRSGAHGGVALKDRLEEADAFRALEGEVGMLREALTESQTRLEFSEHLLAQNINTRAADVPDRARQLP